MISYPVDSSREALQMVSSEKTGGHMDIDKTIDEYRKAKDAMEAIINRHMNAAFGEIKQQFGTTPTYLSIDILPEQERGRKYPHGIYIGCNASLGGK